MGRTTAPGGDDLPLLRPDHVLIGFLRPLGSIETIREVAARGVTSFSVELMPRTTRAQSMDALTSMATIAGYKAVVIGADKLPRIFPMLTTAAGTITPARVLVIGAGVAGLQAIATARRLGAVASAYDLRPASKEQVESLGGRFVELAVEAKDAQDARGYARARMTRFTNASANCSARSSRKATSSSRPRSSPARNRPCSSPPKWWRRMAPGSVIVDLAAERGGNCELTRPGELIVTKHGVTIVGWLNLASTVPYHASQMYARNVTAFILHLVKDGQAPNGHERRNHPRNLVDARRRGRERTSSRVFLAPRPAGIARKDLDAVDLITSLYVFMLAAFIGFEVIRRVSPLLHTPLMSLTNALDAIAVVGAIIMAGESKSTLATVFGTIAIIAATSNVVGGFIITDRMLKMFKASGPKRH